MNSAEQQKLYIDVEEEITTVIDHLRYVQAQNVVLVVPQHALLLQSVVNLKILAQEAHKMRKRIIIMTNDTDGIVFAERAGIATQKYIASDDVQTEQVRQHAQVSAERPVTPPESEARPPQRTQRAVGGSSFHDAKRKSDGLRRPQVEQYGMMASKVYPQQHSNQQNHSQVQQQVETQRTAPQSMQRPVASQQEQHVTDMHAAYDEFSQFEKTLQESPQIQKPHNATSGVTQQPRSVAASTQENSVVRISQKKPKLKKSFNKKSSSQSYSKKGIFFKGMIGFGGAIILTVFVFAVLPKTEIAVTLKQVESVKDFQVELTAKSDQSAFDVDRKIIPARVIEREISFTKTFPATGSGDVDAQKAQGTIIIHNDFNDKSQPLVATTRFLAEDGTLFRLVKKATVPGKKDGEPGKVEALVIADKSGEGGNIGPSRFTVPGFDGSPKKDKFYGQSEQAMTGGGAGGSGVRLVTEEDIAAAEKNMNSEVDEYVQSQINGLLRPDSEILVSEAIQGAVVRSEASVSPGTMGDDFLYEIVSQVKVVVFAQEDVRAVIESGIAQDLEKFGIDTVEMKLMYDAVSVDFENESMKMTVKADVAEVDAPIDVDGFREDIKGMKHDDLLSVIEARYPDSIEKITIESVVPGFPGALADRISRFPSMTDVRVE